jgi:hypothetical protein
MSPYSTNPVLHEYALMEELGIFPDKLEDQYLEFPSFKNIVKWIFGKPLKVLYRKGLESKKVDFWIALLDQKHLSQQEQINEMRRKMD